MNRELSFANPWLFIPSHSPKKRLWASKPSPFHRPKSTLGASTQVYPTPNPASLVGRLTSDGVPRELEEGKGEEHLMMTPSPGAEQSAS